MIKVEEPLATVIQRLYQQLETRNFSHRLEKLLLVFENTLEYHWSGPGRGVLLLEVTIQSLDQGILLITEVTPPWLVLVAFKLLSNNVTEDGDYT